MLPNHKQNRKGSRFSRIALEYHSCLDFEKQTKNLFNGQGQLGGGLELPIKVGQLTLPGGINFTAVGFEGSSGLEVQGVVSSNQVPNWPNLDVDSWLNAYAQGDVILLKRKVTGVRFQVPLRHNSQAPARIQFP